MLCLCQSETVTLMNEPVSPNVAPSHHHPHPHPPFHRTCSHQPNQIKKCKQKMKQNETIFHVPLRAAVSVPAIVVDAPGIPNSHANE